MKFGVVQFPGSNCDADAFHAVSAIVRQPVEFIWHQSEDLAGCDVVILPGGFAFGDYLRTGAIARFSPVMKAEEGLLPGAMMRNQGLRFLCRQVHIRVEATDTPFTSAGKRGQVLEIPIAHMEGNYFCEAAELAELERHNQIIFRYVRADGVAVDARDREANPNGSLHAIAGICNRERNVLGLMPHPERAVELGLGSADGMVIFHSLVAGLAADASPPQRASGVTAAVPA